MICVTYRQSFTWALIVEELRGPLALCSPVTKLGLGLYEASFEVDFQLYPTPISCVGVLTPDYWIHTQSPPLGSHSDDRVLWMWH